MSQAISSVAYYHNVRYQAPLASGLPLLGNAIQMGGDTLSFLTRTYQELGPIFRVRALTRE